MDWFTKLVEEFEVAFIVDNRWKYIVSGIGSTLLLTFLSLVLGVVIGVVIAALRSTYDKQYTDMRAGIGKTLLNIGNGFCKCYLTIFRGTPFT